MFWKYMIIITVQVSLYNMQISKVTSLPKDESATNMLPKATEDQVRTKENRKIANMVFNNWP